MTIEQFAKPRRHVSDVRKVEELHCGSMAQEMYPTIWFNVRAWHWCMRYAEGIGIIEWLVRLQRAEQ